MSEETWKKTEVDICVLINANIKLGRLYAWGQILSVGRVV